MSVAMTLAFRTDVNAPLVTHRPVTLMMQGDDRANVIELTMVDGDTPLNLDGYSAVLYLGRKDGVKVRCPGTVAGNVVKVTLQAECYSVPGPYAATMKLTGPEEERTVLRLAGYVESDGEGPIIDPSGTIPSYDDLERIMRELEDALQQAENATSGANAAAQNANTAAGSANAAAGAANTAAGTANTAAAALNGLTATASTLEPTQPATATAQLVDGAWKITMGVPQGIQGIQGVRGITAFQGSAITGTSTTPTAYATGIEAALAGDLYLYTGTDNANIGNVYTCTQGGDASTALWAYATNWRGAPGSGAVSTVNNFQPDQEGNVNLPGQIYPCTASALEALSSSDLVGIYNQGYRAVQATNNETVVTLGLAADGTLSWQGCNQDRTNLLDNPNFSVAQAGYGGRHGTHIYAADRWPVYNTTLSSGEEGKITIVGGESEGNIYQRFFPTSGPVTIGYFDASENLYLINANIPDVLGAGPIFIASNQYIQVFVNEKTIQVNFVVNAGETVIFSKAFCYSGSYTPKTLPPWEEPNFMTELNKCLRYFQIGGVPGAVTKVSDGMLSVYGGLSVPMRIPPTLALRVGTIDLYSGQDLVFTPNGEISASTTEHAIKFANIPGTFSVSIPNGFVKMNSAGILYAIADL